MYSNDFVFPCNPLFVKFKFISLLNYIIRLQYIQEQSRQTLLPGLKLFYEHPPFPEGAVFTGA